MVQNLIDNSAKFMGGQKDPRITIGRRDIDGASPAFFVRDNGVGIDRPYHDRVFNLFDKLDPRSAGTGVGLALVKRIVEVHGGRIWVESDGPNTGSTFLFTLGDQPSSPVSSLQLPEDSPDVSRTVAGLVPVVDQFARIRRSALTRNTLPTPGNEPGGTAQVEGRQVRGGRRG